MKNSLIIILCFVAGVLLSYLGLLPAGSTESSLSFYILCGLIFLVGVSIGNNPDFIKDLKTINPRFYLLPLVTALGTLGAMALVSLAGRHSLPENMAVGAGFGYYSLSSLFIGQYKGVWLGTLALLVNIFRELITLMGAPWLKKWFGPLAPIAAGGATSMDTTLPVITRVSGQEFAVLSVFHGVVLDFSVPFLVTFFCSLDY